MNILNNFCLYAVLCLLNASLLSGCSDGGKSASSTKKESELSKYSQGKWYKYYRDGSCQTRGNEVCIDAKDAEFLCGKVSGYTPNMLEQAAIRGGDKSRALFQGGSISKLYADWGGDRCVASIAANGLYEGTSSKVRFVGEVASFVISGEGKVLADWVDGYIEE